MTANGGTKNDRLEIVCELQETRVLFLPHGTGGERGIKAKKTEPGPRLHVTIRQGRKKEIVESYMYFSIVDILRTFGADRQDAYDAAKWAGRATDEQVKTVEPDIIMEIRYENNTGRS